MEKIVSDVIEILVVVLVKSRTQLPLLLSWKQFAIKQEYMMFTSKAEKSAKFPPLSVVAPPNGSLGEFA